MHRVTNLGRTCQLLLDTVTKNTASIWGHGDSCLRAWRRSPWKKVVASPDQPQKTHAHERSHLLSHENWPVFKTAESIGVSSLEGQWDCLSKGSKVMAAGLEFCFICPRWPLAKYTVNNSGWSYKYLPGVISLGNSSTWPGEGQGRIGVQMTSQDKLGQQGEQRRGWWVEEEEGEPRAGAEGGSMKLLSLACSSPSVPNFNGWGARRKGEEQGHPQRKLGQ